RRLLQPSLTGLADLRQAEVPRIAVVEVQVTVGDHQWQVVEPPLARATFDRRDAAIAGLRQSLGRLEGSPAHLADENDLAIGVGQHRPGGGFQLATRHAQRPFGHAECAFVRLADIDEHGTPELAATGLGWGDGVDRHVLPGSYLDRKSTRLNS